MHAEFVHTARRDRPAEDWEASEENLDENVEESFFYIFN